MLIKKSFLFFITTTDKQRGYWNDWLTVSQYTDFTCGNEIFFNNVYDTIFHILLAAATSYTKKQLLLRSCQTSWCFEGKVTMKGSLHILLKSPFKREKLNKYVYKYVTYKYT